MRIIQGRGREKGVELAKKVRSTANKIYILLLHSLGAK
jgi:hypothetical protein